MPVSPLHLLLLVFLVFLLFGLVQIGLLSIAFDKLGLPPASGLGFLLFSLFGSLVNFPLLRIESYPRVDAPVPWLWQGSLRHTRSFTGTTLIGVNLGGCILPLVLSLYLAMVHDIPLSYILLAVTVTSLLSYLMSRPIPGLGIGMPMFVAPIAAAITAIMIAPELSAPLAYIAGTLGVLIGADLLRLKDIPQLGTPVAAIGGAGTFDGIFLTGLIAALLA